MGTKSKKQNEIIYELACEFGYGDYSDKDGRIDYKFWEDVPAAEIAYALAEKIEALSELLKAEKEKSNWTLCAERMPDGVGSVLVKFTVDDWGYELITEANHDGSGFFGNYIEDLLCDEREVTFIAWRPIF